MTVRRRLASLLAVPLAIPLAAGLAVSTLLTVHVLTDDGGSGTDASSATEAEVPPVPITPTTDSQAASAASTASATSSTEPRLVFRHTGIDEHLGVIASVPLTEPRGRRAFTGVVCDRVDATPTAVSCLRTVRGVQTRFEQVLMDGDGAITETVTLAGPPSRTRLSPDGSLVASTVFVSGHSYEQTRYSTATEVRAVDGATLGNLEKLPAGRRREDRRRRGPEPVGGDVPRRHHVLRDGGHRGPHLPRPRRPRRAHAHRGARERRVPVDLARRDPGRLQGRRARRRHPVVARGARPRLRARAGPARGGRRRRRPGGVARRRHAALRPAATRPAGRHGRVVPGHNPWRPCRGCS